MISDGNHCETMRAKRYRGEPRKSVPGSLDKKRREKIPSKCHLLLNKRWNHLPPAMFNEPATVPFRWNAALYCRSAEVFS
jgi:hypothetical protein